MAKTLHLLARHEDNPSFAERGYNDVTAIMDPFARSRVTGVGF